MSEWAHDEEGQTEAADFDELLEQFREPDEPPRKKTPGVVWVILAMICALIAGWLAVRATVGFASPKSQHTERKPTKSGDRKPQLNGEAVNVVDDYIARCRKGMTAREVRWIVEDFQKAGLDESRMDRLWKRVVDFRAGHDPGNGPGWMDEKSTEIATKEALRMSTQQRRWYLDVLSNALLLSRQQRTQANEKCEAWFANAEGKFFELQREVVEARNGPGYYPIGEFAPYASLLEASEWLKNEEFAPWELSDLTDDQRSITRHDEVVRERKDFQESYDEDNLSPLSWLERAPSVSMVGASREQIEEALFRTTFDEAGLIFPFDPEQTFTESESGLFEVAKTLHPAQLKILLLLKPELADELMEKLDQTAE